MKRRPPPVRFTGTPRLCVVEPFAVTNVPSSAPAHSARRPGPFPETRGRVIRFDPAWVIDYKDSG